MANSFNPNGEKLKQKILGKITQIDEYMGVTLEHIYTVYGQKLLIITDDSGTWFATKILDLAAHDKILEQLSKAFKTKASVKQLAGVDINESIFSTKELENVLIGEGVNANSSLDKLQFLQHSYYQIQGDYIIQAFTPQVLADRANSTNKRQLSSWLKKKQSQNWDTAILAHSKEVRDAPRDIYHTYLNLMAMLGNFADVDVDLFAFPTAQQLNLPKSGSYGFSVNSSDDALTIQLSYEYSVLENMSFMGSYFSIASLGVLMAYAIPAYRDYTVRAKIGSKLYSVVSEKMIVSEYYYQNKTFPNTELLSEKFNQSEAYLYNPKNGEITLYFTEADDASLVGKKLLLTPEIDSQGSIIWQCSSTIASKKLPMICK
ncbi:MAG: pilin [Proteobacteria bacterium]|nr:pilin [Pseudomonadota bacterium]